MFMLFIIINSYHQNYSQYRKVRILLPTPYPYQNILFYTTMPFCGCCSNPTAKSASSLYLLSREYRMVSIILGVTSALSLFLLSIFFTISSFVLGKIIVPSNRLLMISFIVFVIFGMI